MPLNGESWVVPVVEGLGWKRVGRVQKLDQGRKRENRVMDLDELFS
jgi:hypothetical protein